MSSFLSPYNSQTVLRQNPVRTKPVSGDGLAEDKRAFMTKTKRARHSCIHRVSCYPRSRCSSSSPLLPPSPDRPFTIVRLQFSATPRDNERKLLLLMFRCKITPVEAQLRHPLPPLFHPERSPFGSLLSAERATRFFAFFPPRGCNLPTDRRRASTMNLEFDRPLQNVSRRAINLEISILTVPLKLQPW